MQNIDAKSLLKLLSDADVLKNKEFDYASIVERWVPLLQEKINSGQFNVEGISKTFIKVFMSDECGKYDHILDVKECVRLSTEIYYRYSSY